MFDECALPGRDGLECSAVRNSGFQAHDELLLEWFHVVARFGIGSKPRNCECRGRITPWPWLRVLPSSFSAWYTRILTRRRDSHLSHRRDRVGARTDSSPPINVFGANRRNPRREIPASNPSKAYPAADHLPTLKSITSAMERQWLPPRARSALSRFCSQPFLIACAPSRLFYVGCLALRSSSP